MSGPTEGTYYKANNLADALSALRERGSNGEPLAGGTWVMRANVRGEALERAYVSIAKLEELKQITITDKQVEIGAAVTHQRLTAYLGDIPVLHGLFLAVSKAANPSVRNVATVGGNLCSVRFLASDLVPALLCIDAKVVLSTLSGSYALSMQEFLSSRNSLEPGTLVSKVQIPLQPLLGYRTSHERLPLRKAGDYPVAIVSTALMLDRENRIQSARFALGSVEASPRRWHELEAAAVGCHVDDPLLKQIAAAACVGVSGRDGVEAPGWYRTRVLPSLAYRAAVAAAKS